MKFENGQVRLGYNRVEEMKKKTNTNPAISLHWGDKPPKVTAMNFGLWRDLVDVIKCAHLVFVNPEVFQLADSQKQAHPNESLHHPDK